MRRLLSPEQIEEFRREFRKAYGLDREFGEAFARWGQAGGPERIVPIKHDALDVRTFVLANGDAKMLAVIDDALGNRPLDGETLAVQKALTGVLGAIDRGRRLLEPYLAPRAMLTNPDPVAALMIARDVLTCVPFIERRRKRGRRSKELKNRVVEVLARLRCRPVEITKFLIDVGYSPSEANEKNVTATIQKLEQRGKRIPINRTSKNRKRHW